MGAHLNAYTSREQTVYYAKSFTSDLDKGRPSKNDVCAEDNEVIKPFLSLLSVHQSGNELDNFIFFKSDTMVYMQFLVCMHSHSFM